MLEIIVIIQLLCMTIPFQRVQVLAIELRVLSDTLVSLQIVVGVVIARQPLDRGLNHWLFVQVVTTKQNLSPTLVQTHQRNAYREHVVSGDTVLDVIDCFLPEPYDTEAARSRRDADRHGRRWQDHSTSLYGIHHRLDDIQLHIRRNFDYGEAVRCLVMRALDQQAPEVT